MNLCPGKTPGNQMIFFVSRVNPTHPPWNRVSWTWNVHSSQITRGALWLVNPKWRHQKLTNHSTGWQDQVRDGPLILPVTLYQSHSVPSTYGARRVPLVRHLRNSNLLVKPCRTTRWNDQRNPIKEVRRSKKHLNFHLQETQLAPSRRLIERPETI